MNREQLIKIAKAGFPESIFDTIDLDNCDVHHQGGCYRLYDMSAGFFLMLPRQSYLTVFMGGNNFIQITCGNLCFDHYAAIKEIERLGLIKGEWNNKGLEPV